MAPPRAASLFLALTLAVSAGGPNLAEAASRDAGPRLGLHLGLEHFRWEERDDSGKLLDETGPRARAAITLDNFLRPGEGAVYRLEVQGYYGRVDYDGQTQTGTPLKTDVDYAGGLAEGRIGYRFEIIRGTYGLDLLGGVGFETWERDIREGLLPDGTTVQGYREEYRIGYARFGLGLADLAGPDWFGRLELGARYPLKVEEEISDPINADLNPAREVSLYVSYEVARTPESGPSIGVTFYYDSFRLKESPVGSSDIGPVLQPDSDMDVVGIRLGVFF